MNHLYIKNRYKNILLLSFLLCSLNMSACLSNNDSEERALAHIDKIVNEQSYLKKSEMHVNPYENLCVPTQMTKIRDDYYIVDCYHSQIITSKNSTAPVNEWTTVSDDILMGHSIASDGIVYLCDDTENNRILAYIKSGDVFYLNQEFTDVGLRPHFVEYFDKYKSFYALSSLTGEFYIYKREKNSANVILEKVVAIPELYNIYIRSFSIIDDLIYLPAGDGNIYIIDPKSFEILSSYPLPDELAGPTQISRINDYYYLTVSTDNNINPDFANLVRAKSLDDFNNNNYEVVKDLFTDDGTPYVITDIDGKFYLAWHSEIASNCMWSFSVNSDNQITDINHLFN